MAGKIYETPTPAKPVLSVWKDPSTNWRPYRLMMPSSISERRLMLSGLVPDANVCTHPASIAEMDIYYTKEVDPDGNVEVKKTRNVSDDNDRWLSYEHDTGKTSSGMTDAEIKAASNANYNEGLAQVLAMLDELPDTFDPAVFGWNHGEEVYRKPFPHNDIPAACPVSHEFYELGAWGNVRTAHGSLVRNLSSERRAIVFPGARVGARVKATLTVSGARVRTSNGMRALVSGNRTKISLQHALHLMEGNRVWTREFADAYPDLEPFVGAWPDSVPDQWGNVTQTFYGHQIIKILKYNTLVATDAEATRPTDFENDSFEAEVEFTVPESRIIVPFLQLESAGMETWHNYCYFSNYSTWIEGRVQSATLTINQIGT